MSILPAIIGTTYTPATVRTYSKSAEKKDPANTTRTGNNTFGKILPKTL